MKDFGTKLATAGVALVGASAITVAPTVHAPPRPEPAVQLAAATSPTVVQQQAPPANVLGALFSLDLREFIIPPSVGQPLPTPPQLPGPSPAPTAFQFEDLIINTYNAIEPWVRYGFQLGAYAVGWVPWVGWLSPQIMIFYNFGERIVESLVVNSANWLWGPLPFAEGLGNIARDSWDALVQLGIDEWNFWLPPLPPLPFAAQQTQVQPEATDVPAPEDQSVTSPTARPHPLRHMLTALRQSLAGPERIAVRDADPLVNDATPVDVPGAATPATPIDDPQDQAALAQSDTTPASPPLGKPKPFSKKPKPDAERPNRAFRSSNETVETSPRAALNERAGTAKPPKNRFNRANPHRSTGSPSP